MCYRSPAVKKAKFSTDLKKALWGNLLLGKESRNGEMFGSYEE
jgi:hypothetical protein